MKNCEYDHFTLPRAAPYNHALINNDYPPDLLNRSYLSLNKVGIPCAAEHNCPRYENIPYVNYTSKGCKCTQGQCNTMIPVIPSKTYVREMDKCSNCYQRAFIKNTDRYNSGTSSVVPKFGNRLQRSWSFINNPCRSGVDCLCNCDWPYTTFR